MRTPPEAHVALLRGINVAGKNPLPMATLSRLFSEHGCTEVRTYIQSGNVVFNAPAPHAGRAAAAVTAALKQRFGYAVPILLRSAAELSRVLQANPFLDPPGIDPRLLHVMFLAEAPGAQAIAGLDSARSPPDRFAALGREVYLHCPNGLGRSKLTNDYFDRRLGTRSTCRNWRTVAKLHALAKASAAT